MNSLNDNIHTALDVTQDKKVCIQALGRVACSKSKLHSPPQADHNGKPINACICIWICIWGGKWGQCTVSVLDLVPNIGISAWATGTQDAQCEFHPVRSTMDQTFVLQKVLKNYENMPKRCIHAL